MATSLAATSLRARCKQRGLALLQFAMRRPLLLPALQGTRRAAGALVDIPLQIPSNEAALRRFLLAQLNWERYHSARLRLVHAAAAGALCLWVLATLHADVPRAILAGCAACFLAASFAAMMEWRWQRQRDRCMGEMGGSK